RSTLGVVFEQQARVLELQPTPERAPEAGFFFRSDHFPFARAGVPALFLDHGTRFRGRSEQWSSETLGRYLDDHYHRPTDDRSRVLSLAGAVQQARLAFLIGHSVASADEVPRWYDNGQPAAR